MINFLINWQDVNNGVLAALRMLLLKLCEPIYSLIVFCFDIFEDFGELRLFEGSDTISMIYNRVGLILGLFMVFRITFTAIEYLVDPDKILDSKQGIGNIIKKVLIVVILLGSTRYIFNFAFDFQSKLIESDVVGNLILGPSYIEENKYSAGTNLAWFTFTQFYTLNDRAKNDNNYENCRIMLSSGNGAEANSGGSIYNDFHDNHKFNNAEYCLNLKTNDKYSIDSNVKEKQELNIIDFSGFICLAVGAVLLWIIMTYTVQVAVRVFQLAYLELIAPIPIMMYLMPNGDEKLKKWAKQCLTTFLDFFIRLAIMDFIILVSNALVELEDTDSMLVTFNKLSFWGSGYVKIILIIALFAFVKKVPELLKELFPSTGGAASFGFGIKSPKAVWDAWKSTPILGAGAKAIGHMGNLGKKASGFVAKNTVGRAWGATGGRVINRMKANYNTNAENRKAHYEYKDKLRDIDATYKKYGSDFEAGNYDKVFGDEDYITTYQNLQNAKAAAKAAYGENTEEYKNAIQPFKDAHEAQQTAKPILAAREKALKAYANYHPTSQNPSWSSAPSPSQPAPPPSQPAPPPSQSAPQPSSQPVRVTYPSMSAEEAEWLFKNKGIDNMSEEEQLMAYEALERAEGQDETFDNIFNDRLDELQNITQQMNQSNDNK